MEHLLYCRMRPIANNHPRSIWLSPYGPMSGEGRIVWVRRTVLASILSVLAPSVGAIDYLVNEPGRWSAWKFRAQPFTTKLYGASANDLNAFETQLRALDAMIRRAPAVAKPIGFSAQTWGYLSAYEAIAPAQPKGVELPLGGGLSFGAFSIFEYQRNGKTVREDGGETQLMNFVVNDIQPALLGGRQRPSEWEGVDTDAFLQPASSGVVAGFPRYGNYIVITKRQTPIWLPVSMESALRLVIAAEQKRMVYLRDTRGPAAEIQRIEAKIAGLESHIASLRPEDRAAPACSTGRGEAWGQRFQIGVAADCRPLVRPNWAFFDRQLPRSAPQVLLVTDIARCYAGKPSTDPGGCTTNRQLLESLDRQALMDWLH